jgi:hypothetical protein
MLVPSNYNGVAEVYPEGLALDAPDAMPTADSSGIVTIPLLSVQQDGLEGDFSLTVVFDAFTVGDGYGSFNVELADGAGSLYAQLSQGELDATYAPPNGAPSSQNAPVNATSGTVLIQRTGATAAVTLTAAGSSVSITGAIGTGEVALHLDAFAPRSGGDLTVLVKSVTLSGGAGTFQSDAFSCDSVHP